MAWSNMLSPCEVMFARVGSGAIPEEEHHRFVSDGVE